MAALNKKEVVSIIREYHENIIRYFPRYKLHFPNSMCLWSDIEYRYREIKTILEYFTLPPPAKVLDVGTGYGQVMYFFKKKGYEVCGVDDDWGGRYKNGKEDEKIPYIEKMHCGLEKGIFPFPSHTFDLVTCLNTIEHIPCSPKKILRETFKVMKKSGIVFISQPNIAEIGKRVSFFVKGKSPYCDITNWFNVPPEDFTGHSREYTKRELNYMIQKVGFENLDSGFYDLEYYKWLAIRKQFPFVRRMLERLCYRPFRIMFPPLRSQVFVVGRRND